VLVFWRCCTGSGAAFIFCGLAILEAASEPTSESASPQAAEGLEERISLKELIERAENSELVKRGTGAILDSAKLKMNQVQMERWLTTFELSAFSGVVPDVNADTAVANQNANDLLFGLKSDQIDEGALSRLGPFVKTEVKMVQPLFTWGKISGYENMAEHNLAVAEAEKSKQLSELRMMVKRAYYTLQLARESSKVLDEVRERLVQVERKVEELLVKGGKSSENVEETDRLKIRVFQTDVENRALDAYRGQKAALATLFELAGAAGQWKPKDDNLAAEVVTDIEKDALIASSMRARPEIRQIDEYIKIKTAERTTIRSAYFPTLFAAGQVDFAFAPGRTDIENPFLSDEFNKFGMAVALGLKQDLGVHRTWNKLKQIDAEIVGLRAQRERVAILSRLRVDETFEKAVAAQRAIEINENGFRAARSWLTSAGLSFSLGTSPTKDVLESYAAYFKARVDLLRAIYELNIALAELSLVSGAEIVERYK
jgi:outer membrane protein TolC